MTAADLVQPRLDFSPELQLPHRSAGAQTYGFIARKGGGKSYAAGKLAELLYGVGVPLIIIDPVGIWWGLRVNADGRAAPLIPIAVIGGLHGDLDIELGHAEHLARHLVETGSSLVLDVSQLRKGKRAHFVAEFCEALFAAVKAQPKRRQRMVIFEEAQDFAPQHANGPSARLLGAVDDIVRLGRNFGLGATLITQRPQSVHKEVLNQIECLFVGQLAAKHERDAIKGWILAKDDAVRATTEALSQLPYLAPGDFYCWSPQWLQLFIKTRCYPKQTFDASATPELDDEQPETPALQAMDLDALRAVLGTAEAAPSPEGPRPSDAGRDRELDSLRAERSEGAAELLRLHADHATVAAAVVGLRRENAELRRTLRELIGTVDDFCSSLDGMRRSLTEGLDRLRGKLDDADPWQQSSWDNEITIDAQEATALLSALNEPRSPSADLKRILARRRSPASQIANDHSPPEHPSFGCIIPGRKSRVILPADPVGPTGATGGAGPQGLGRCALAIVGALNQLGPMSRLRLAVLTGYQHDGGGFRNSLSELRGRDVITGTDPIEPAPSCILIDGPRPARGKALVDLWSAQLGACARGCLATLLGQARGATYAVTREWLAAHTLGSDGKPYAADGGGFRNSLSELRRAGLAVNQGKLLLINPIIAADLTAR